jgi:hypothetical protein
MLHRGAIGLSGSIGGGGLVGEAAGERWRRGYGGASASARIPTNDGETRMNKRSWNLPWALGEAWGHLVGCGNGRRGLLVVAAAMAGGRAGYAMRGGSAVLLYMQVRLRERAGFVSKEGAENYGTVHNGRGAQDSPTGGAVGGPAGSMGERGREWERVPKRLGARGANEGLGRGVRPSGRRRGPRRRDVTWRCGYNAPARMGALRR